MKKLISLLLLVTMLPVFGYAQVNEVNFYHQRLDFSAAPRSTLSPMSIKLWDNYGNGGPTTYGTVMEIYGLHGHQTSQLYFGGWDDSKIRYRESFYAEPSWSEWITMLDSKNNVQSRGNLMITGNGTHYIAGGNVGVGTTNPASKLDVLGDISSFHVGVGQTDISRSVKKYVNLGSNNHGSLLLSSNLYFEGNDLLKTAIAHPSLAGSAIVMPGNSMPNQGSIAFYTNPIKAVNANDNFTGSLSMIIKDNGHVGIGTTSPKEKLSVNGHIRAKEVKVEAENWPDYVFNHDYKVMGLPELEEYIKTHKRLPEMPSATEVAADGVELGEMNKLLLKKQEELTLLLIEQYKQVQKLVELTNTQQTEIDKLKKSVNKN